MIATRRNIPKILFLRDVYIRDLQSLDYLFEKKIKESLMDNISNEPNIYSMERLKIEDYEKIPNVFENLNTWIKSTNLLCWNCNNKVTNQPKFIPKIIEPNIEGKLSIGVEGNFCHWNCCISYIDDKYPRLVENKEKKMQLYYLYNLWYGKRPKTIMPAPSKYLQKPYGGNLSVEEYYAKFDPIINI